MPIRPIDIRRKEFKSSFRGYDPNQVDDFLDAVADEFERTYTDVMENMEVASAREIETSLRERLDTESIAVVREAAQEEARSAEEEMVTAQAPDAQDTLSGLEGVEPAEEDWEIQEIGSAADEQPTAVIRAEGSEPLADEPETEVTISELPEVVEPSTVQDETDQTEAVQEPPSTEAASEVEREEPSLAEESSSQHFFDREGEQSDSRIFRASRFLRRRE